MLSWTVWYGHLSVAFFEMTYYPVCVEWDIKPYTFSLPVPLPVNSSYLAPSHKWTNSTDSKLLCVIVLHVSNDIKTFHKI